MKIERCTSKSITFTVIRVTEELSEEVLSEFEKARDLDNLSENLRQTWHAIFKFHGLVWDDIWGYGFLANYGKENQRRRQHVGLDDRIIEDSTGEQFLISRELFERYFM